METTHPLQGSIEEPSTTLVHSVSTEDAGPIPMSFPAILRGTGLTDRFAHLRVSTVGAASIPAKSRKAKRDENEGKRWVRRRENAQFAGNVHIAAATKQDYSVPTPNARATFPQPLPVYLHRNNPVLPAEMPQHEPISAKAGRFSLSLKGMRKELRRSGPRTDGLVREIEHEVLDWLVQGVWLNPDIQVTHFDTALGTPIGSSGAIIEVSRSPSQLIWSIQHDSFVRYVVHCCARYHNIVSFSKDTSGVRLTYLLRPSAQPISSAAIGLDTPPVTDLESSVDPESDFAFSERDSHLGSDIESDLDAESAPSSSGLALSDIAESIPTSPHLLPALAPAPADIWSPLGESDIDAEAEDEREHELVQSVHSLDLSDAEATPRAPLRLRHSHLWEHRRRSASSPSRSPARRNPPRARPRVDPPRAKPSPQSFYDYLFA